MKKRMTSFLTVVSAAVFCYVIAAWWAGGRTELLAKLFGPISREPIDFETLELRPSPNQYLVCPSGLCKETPHREAPVFNIPVDELERRWLAVTAREPRIRLLAEAPEKRQYDFEQRTRLVGFPDTITVRFLPAGEGRSMLAIYSRSHYGHSDLGANQARIERWLGLLADEIR